MGQQQDDPAADEKGAKDREDGDHQAAAQPRSLFGIVGPQALRRGAINDPLSFQLRKLAQQPTHLKMLHGCYSL